MNPILRKHFLPFTIDIITRLIHLTCKIKITDPNNNNPKQNKTQKTIYTFWHGSLFSILFELRNSNLAMLASPSKDGEIASRVLKKWRHQAISGSSSKQPKKAYQDCINILNNNDNIGITPDGPRGPYRKAHSGAIRMAIETNSAIVPIACDCSKYIELKSWDKHKIPYPFSTIYLMFGDAIYFNSIEEKENLEKREIKKPLRKFEEAINNLNQKCSNFAKGQKD